MNAVRRRAWWYLVAMSGLLALFGIMDVLAGAAADPGIALGLSGLSLAEIEAQDPVGYRLFDFVTRTQGLLLIATGVLLIAILLVPYRAGRRWAWVVAWTLPAWSFAVLAAYLLVGVAPDQTPPPPMLSGPILGAVAVVVLVVDRSRFREGSPDVEPARVAGSPEAQRRETGAVEGGATAP